MFDHFLSLAKVTSPTPVQKLGLAEFSFEESNLLAMASSGTSTSIPIFRTAVALVAMASIPLLSMHAKNLVDGHSWAYKVVWAIAMAVNFITVGLPGRFDSEAQENKKGFPWVTLFEPAGWAFAIWGVIYAGELALTAYVASIGKEVTLFKKAAPLWLAGNLFQSLWCLTFRPQFKSVLWLPMSLLASASAAFLGCHQVLSEGLMAQAWSQPLLERLAILLIRSPVSLHTAWLAAATCLNLNGWTVTSGCSYSAQIAVAFASCFIGAIYAVAATWYTKDPLIAGTIAWALSALVSRTLIKVEQNAIPYISADTQKALALTEKVMANGLIALAVSISVLSAIPSGGL
eukprot:gene28015-33829_t